MPHAAAVAVYYAPNIVLERAAVANVNSVAVFVAFDDNGQWIFKFVDQGRW